MALFIFLPTFLNTLHCLPSHLPSSIPYIVYLLTCLPQYVALFTFSPAFSIRGIVYLFTYLPQYLTLFTFSPTFLNTLHCLPSHPPSQYVALFIFSPTFLNTWHCLPFHLPFSKPCNVYLLVCLLQYLTLAQT